MVVGCSLPVGDVNTCNPELLLFGLSDGFILHEMYELHTSILFQSLLFYMNNCTDVAFSIKTFGLTFVLSATSALLIFENDTSGHSTFVNLAQTSSRVLFLQD